MSELWEDRERERNGDLWNKEPKDLGEVIDTRKRCKMCNGLSETWICELCWTDAARAEKDIESE